MVSMPLVVAFGFVAWLMIRKGGWKFGTVAFGVVFGLLLATTPYGPDLTNGINEIVEQGAAAISESFGGS
ncbi:MAG: hypothetical protein GEU93_09920 [Propionibacteriales bacterium]|nr:hypothetical protein [Propionibacteriales bacterium]